MLNKLMHLCPMKSIVCRSLILFSLALIVSGCTPAPANNSQTSVEQISQNLRQCLGEVRTQISPLLATVIEKTGENAQSIPTERLADTSRPTPTQIENIYKIIDAYRPCEQAYESQINAIAPRLADVHRSFIDARAQNAVALRRDRLSWGEYNQRRLAIWRQHQQAYQQAMDRMNYDAELVRRKEAAMFEREQCRRRAWSAGMNGSQGNFFQAMAAADRSANQAYCP